jgi:hypothetical protein
MGELALFIGGWFVAALVVAWLLGNALRYGAQANGIPDDESESSVSAEHVRGATAVASPDGGESQGARVIPFPARRQAWISARKSGERSRSLGST